ncbi:unnamed protein product [Fraxinus pennsylvanica]|uniref:Uncharacterized protein n=1 Tax=Fraxinus pennsylvanica TaxID=56036 RepID=A0AAD1ZPM8_9LAMI|nr:unnamed protein product [Fraxinus pennsylvanica]
MIDAPLSLVWSLVREFDNPQAVHQDLQHDCWTRRRRKCTGDHGCLRPPAGNSVELDFLDDASHVMVFTIIGGDHKLVNYQSTTTLHEDDTEEKSGGAGDKTVVIESYVADISVDSCKEDTCLFADTIIGCAFAFPFPSPVR